jgi:hypothetical protein
VAICGTPWSTTQLLSPYGSFFREEIPVVAAAANVERFRLAKRDYTDGLKSFKVEHRAFEVSIFEPAAVGAGIANLKNNHRRPTGFQARTFPLSELVMHVTSNGAPLISNHSSNSLKTSFGPQDQACEQAELCIVSNLRGYDEGLQFRSLAI